MKNIPDKQIIEQFLHQVCNHKYFKKSPRNVRLLNFLVEQAIARVDVKEHVIGLELFENSYDPEKNDGKVRVYMFNLRKKLQEYYESDGKEDALFFEIKKGQYNLNFVDRKIEETKKDSLIVKIVKKTSVTQKIVSVVLLSLAIAFFISFLKPEKEKYCWNSFFESNAKNICVVSDHFVVSEKENTGGWVSSYISGINNDSDLMEYAHKRSDKVFQSADYSLLTKMAPLSIHQLTKWFIANKSDFLVRLESEFGYDEARENNILFIGQFKTMNASKSFFLNNSKHFSVFKDGFKYVNGEGEKFYTTRLEESQRTEYAMVSFMKLENGKNALFLTSNNDIGTIATVRNFTDYAWLKEFYDSMPEECTYFNALFEVSGMVRTDMSCKLVQFEVLNK